jgi:hypothetical protein
VASRSPRLERRLEYKQERWQRTFVQAELNASERAALTASIKRLMAGAPLDGDIKMGRPPVMMDEPIYSHQIPGTVLRVKYELTDEAVILYQIRHERW